MYVSGSVVEVFHDAEGTFTGIFFQDVQMRQMYASFPEVIMADATYKLTDLRMPLFLMIGIDGNGHSQVIAVYMTCNETTTALTHMLEVCLSSLQLLERGHVGQDGHPSWLTRRSAQHFQRHGSCSL